MGVPPLRRVDGPVLTTAPVARPGRHAPGWRRQFGRRAVLVACAGSVASVLPTASAHAVAGSPIDGATALSRAAASPAPAPPAAPLPPSAPVPSAGGPPPAAAATGPAATVPTPAPPIPAPTPGARDALSALSGATRPAPAPAGAPAVGTQKSQTVTGAKRGGPGPTGVPFGAPPAPAPAVKPTPPAVATALRQASGLPTAGNPTLTLAPIGPVPIGVPNFFIEKFQIPPFLIPIYQAAGVEYDVPWQVLAAINEIETDYGRNLAVSSAGATGWMQFLPATWRQYGVDANRDGVEDPYNPADAIFAAARFLHAAGASHNLRTAVFAYNNAGWYVDSVMLRAKLIGGLPPALVSSVTGLTDGIFPVHAAARYADDVAEATAARASQGNAPTAPAASPAIKIYARAGSPAIAVHDGVITAIGRSPALGTYVRLRDAYGNTYTYGQLKTVNDRYAAPVAGVGSAPPVTGGLVPPADPVPHTPASAGHQPGTTAAAGPAPAPAPAAGAAPPAAGSGAHPPTDTPASSRRLFAHPLRRAAFTAGGWRQVRRARPAASAVLAPVLADPSSLNPARLELRPLTRGAQVIGGAILGRLGVTVPGQAPHLTFQIVPGGKGSPAIDPKPILDGWKLLESTALYRAANLDPLVGGGAANPTIGQILLETKTQLERRVLGDPSIDIYPCGRQDIQSGLIDQRVLAPLAVLSASGLKPSVTGLRCGSSLAGTPFDTTGNLSANAAGTGVDISKINGIPVLGHQGHGSVTDLAVRRLLTLQGIFRPDAIISLTRYRSSDNTLGRRDHANRIQIEFTPPAGPAGGPGAQAAAALNPEQWFNLVAGLSRIPNPTVSGVPSSAAIPAGGGR